MGFATSQISARVDEAIELVGLEGKENHLPEELSGGSSKEPHLQELSLRSLT